jgi:hypothetical protein
LVSYLESHRLTKGQINFADQTVNQKLALESSSHHFYSTIDLKDASDRVSLALVERLLPDRIFRYVKAVRSHATLLPDGRTLQLSKHAPMGSATCFSIEALVFWAVCVAAVRESTGWTGRECARHVFVYGDDIIVPTITFDAVVEALESVGLVVNRSKSFCTGDFRESCGIDAFRGEEVQPTRFSTVWNASPSDGGVLASYLSYSNELERKGYHALAGFLRRSLRAVHRVIPYGTARSGYPCILVGSPEEAVRLNKLERIPWRYNPRLQREEFRVPTLHAKVTESTLEGWLRLLRNNVDGASRQNPDEVVHPRSTKVRRKWVAVHSSPTCEGRVVLSGLQRWLKK